MSMKLLTYDHCPYCVRARMLIKPLNLDVTVQHIPNHDHETPEGLIGKKMVPILVKEDGSAMGESLDIVAYLDDTYNSGEKISKDIRPEVSQWMQDHHRTINYLMMPRCIQIGLDEFKEEEAVHYFKTKKENYIGSFDEHLAETPTYLKSVEQALSELSTYIRSDNSLNETFSYEDIHIFPILRNLTMVKGLTWDPKVRSYVEAMSKKTGIPLFFDRAI